MKKYLLASVFLHLSALYSIRMISDTPQFQTISVDIEINRKPSVSTGHQSHAPPLNEMGERKAAQDEAGKNPFDKKDYKFKSYLDRIYNSIYPDWIREVRKAIGKKKIRIDYVTVVWVVIDRIGNVVRVILIQSCNEEAYDKAAIKVMEGRFFPNPPKDLIDSDGYGRILWKYVIYKDEGL